MFFYKTTQLLLLLNMGVKVTIWVVKAWDAKQHLTKFIVAIASFWLSLGEGYQELARVL